MRRPIRVLGLVVCPSLMSCGLLFAHRGNAASDLDKSNQLESYRHVLGLQPARADFSMPSISKIKRERLLQVIR